MEDTGAAPRTSNLLNATAPPGRVLVGTAAVALVLGLSRWGTNIGFSPLFITDVLIAFSLVNWALSSRMKGARPVTGWVSRATPTFLFQAFFFFMLARFLFAVGNGPIFMWLRDGIPFLYGIMAFVAARSLAISEASTRAKTMRVFWYAMGFHLVWTSLVHFTGTNAGFPVPGIFSAPVFQLRPDIDSAIIAVTVGMCLRQLLVGKHKFWALAGMLVGVITVFTLGTRAGLISVFVALALSFGLTYAATHKLNRRRVAMVLSVPALILIIAIALPATTPGQRLIATIDSSQSGTGAQQNAQGTQRAREMVWTAIIDWTGKDTARQLVGSGFGNDFLEESGSKTLLEGTTYTNVRSPHNWFVGIYARMGLVGLALSIAFIGQLLAIMARHRQRIGDDPLFSLSALTIVAILPVASLGVVLEAPFGAVPFFWAAGILMTLAPVRHRSEAGHAGRALAPDRDSDRSASVTPTGRNPRP